MWLRHHWLACLSVSICAGNWHVIGIQASEYPRYPEIPGSGQLLTEGLKPHVAFVANYIWSPGLHFYTGGYIGRIYWKDILEAVSYACDRYDGHFVLECPACEYVWLEYIFSGNLTPAGVLKFADRSLAVKRCSWPSRRRRSAARNSPAQEHILSLLAFGPDSETSSCSIKAIYGAQRCGYLFGGVTTKYCFTYNAY
jgi:hypothetical protein